MRRKRLCADRENKMYRMSRKRTWVLQMHCRIRPIRLDRVRALWHAEMTSDLSWIGVFSCTVDVAVWCYRWCRLRQATGRYLRKTPTPPTESCSICLNRLRHPFRSGHPLPACVSPSVSWNLDEGTSLVSVMPATRITLRTVNKTSS